MWHFEIDKSRGGSEERRSQSEAVRSGRVMIEFSAAVLQKLLRELWWWSGKEGKTEGKKKKTWRATCQAYKNKRLKVASSWLDFTRVEKKGLQQWFWCSNKLLRRFSTNSGRKKKLDPPNLHPRWSVSGMRPSEERRKPPWTKPGLSLASALRVFSPSGFRNVEP